MAKYAFVVPPLYGHINPTLSLGNALLKRDNEVVWIGVDSDSRMEKILPEGGKFLSIAHDYDEQTIKELRNERINAPVQGIESLKILYEVDLIPLNQFMLDGIMHHLTEYRPDVVIYDCQLFAGAVAAAKLGIPYVASVTAPASIKAFDALPKLHEWENNQIIDFQKRNGIPCEMRLENSADLVLVYTSKLLFGKKKLPLIYQFVGPIIKDRPTGYDFDWKHFEAMTDRPRILVSIGTTFEDEEKLPFFQKTIEAFKDENLSVIMLSDPGLYKEIPSNFIIRKRIPQLEVLPYLDLVICHGGQNTVAETLSCGIPLIVLPIAYDQSQVASDVVQAGAGLRLKFSRFKPEDLKKAVHEILNNKEYKQNAEAIQTSFKEAGGVDRAISLLENIVKK
jgi:MGT family glycosyltransferase